MTQFQRTGELKSLASYPVWLQRVVRETSVRKKRVVEHELFVLMRDAKLPLVAMQRFLIGVWPTIEQFPRFMSMNLKKAGYGEGAGVDMARETAQGVGEAGWLKAQALSLPQKALDERSKTRLHAALPGQGSATSIKLRLSSLA